MARESDASDCNVTSGVKNLRCGQTCGPVVLQLKLGSEWTGWRGGR